MAFAVVTIAAALWGIGAFGASWWWVWLFGA